MSQLIYQSPVQTAAGQGEVRITDTSPGSKTPDLSRLAIMEGFTLKMGDRGEVKNGFPLTQGSSFELQIEDPTYAFQNLFLTAFDDQRFEVTLDMPQTGAWHGYVKSTLQTRALTRETRLGVTTVKCFDGLALLGEDDTAVNARSMDVKSFLVRAFEEANPDLPILFYSDLTARTIEGNDVGFDKLRPIEGNPRTYEPPQPNGPSGPQAEEGLKGDTLRDQLSRLGEILTSVAYQDIRQEAWAFMEVPAIGAPVTVERYDGSWSSYSLPEQTVSVEAKGVDLTDKDKALKTKQSVRAVRANISNWFTDPGFEASLNGDDLSYWNQLEVLRNGNGYLIRESTVNNPPAQGGQKVDLSNFDLFDEFDAIRVVATITSAINGFRVKFYFENGDVHQEQQYGGTKNLYLEKDPPGGHSGLDAIEPFVEPGSGAVKTMRLNFLEKLTDNSINQDGVNNKYRELSSALYRTRNVGRTTVEPDAAGLLTVLSGGSEVPAEKWKSSRYSSGPYGRLSRWRAVNNFNLRPPPFERASTELLGAFAPLGTRIKLTKPGNSSPTVFVPKKGRDLQLMPSELTTEIDDVEIPDSVIDSL